MNFLTLQELNKLPERKVCREILRQVLQEEQRDNLPREKQYFRLAAC